MSDGDCSERKIVVANDTKSAKNKNPKLKPNVSGFNLEKEEQRSEHALTIILKEKSSEQAMRSLLRRGCGEGI